MKTLTEEFATSPAHKDYCALLDAVRSVKPRDGREASDEYDAEFYKTVELYIRYGAFKKIGKGSSRTAYAFDADPRFVLKFAHNDNGLKQSQTELKNVKKGDYKCLVRVLDYDSDGIFIVEDFHRETTYGDWNRIIGISPNMLSKIVRVTFERAKADAASALCGLLEEIRDPDCAARILRKTSPLDDAFTLKGYTNILACVENLVAASGGEMKDERWIALFDLFRFYGDNGFSAMIPEELLYIDQWGVKPGVTSGKDALVIIDPGVDEDFRPFAGKDGRIR